MCSQQLHGMELLDSPEPVPSQLPFQVWKQEEVTGCKVRTARWVAKGIHVCFHNTGDSSSMSGVRLSTVMQNQETRPPELRPLVTFFLMEMSKHCSASCGIDGCSFGHELNDSFVIEECGHHCLPGSVGGAALAWSGVVC